MDLRKLDTIKAANKGMDFFVKDLDGVETDIEISIVGVGSAIHNEAYAEREHEIAKLDKQKAPTTPLGIVALQEAKEALYIISVAKCMKGWKNLEVDGKAVEFSYENAIKILTEYPIIKMAVLSAISDTSAFLEQLNKG